jgi:hypothetical protein
MVLFFCLLSSLLIFVFGMVRLSFRRFSRPPKV